jgi:hypothetical protein
VPGAVRGVTRTVESQEAEMTASVGNEGSARPTRERAVRRELTELAAELDALDRLIMSSNQLALVGLKVDSVI